MWTRPFGFHLLNLVSLGLFFALSREGGRYRLILITFDDDALPSLCLISVSSFVLFASRAYIRARGGFVS